MAPLLLTKNSSITIFSTELPRMRRCHHGYRLDIGIFHAGQSSSLPHPPPTGVSITTASSGFRLHTGGSAERFNTAGVTFQSIASDFARFAAVQSERRNTPVMGQNDGMHGFEKTHTADNAVAAFMFAPAAGIRADGKAFNLETV